MSDRDANAAAKEEGGSAHHRQRDQREADRLSDDPAEEGVFRHDTVLLLEANDPPIDALDELHRSERDRDGRNESVEIIADALQPTKQVAHRLEEDVPDQDAGQEQHEGGGLGGGDDGLHLGGDALEERLDGGDVGVAQG